MKSARRSLLFFLPFLALADQYAIATCTSANGRTANWASANVVVSGSVPPVVSAGVSGGMNQWNDCNENQWEFPWFVPSGGEVTITLMYVEGFFTPSGPSSCAMYTGPPSGSSGTITLYSQGRDQAGTPISCIHDANVVSDRVAHELGHFLGLDNSPCSGNTIMAGPGGFNDSSREIANSECSLVDALSTNDIEQYEEECGGSQGCGNQGGGSPIILDLDGDRFHFTSVADGVNFDIDGDGETERVAWTQEGALDAFLWRDSNANGMIDSGRELFGDITRGLLSGATAEHGYIPLAEFDTAVLGGNENGAIDPGDAFYQQLGLWIDFDHNGISQTGEVLSLRDAGVEGISLSYRESRRVDTHGNELRFVSRSWIWINERLRKRATTDVFFVFED